jgi:hypothetical protein
LILNGGGRRYFFCDLPDTSQSDEQAAINAGRIQATGIRYIGKRR